jgi:hypothetical protein
VILAAGYFAIRYLGVGIHETELRNTIPTTESARARRYGIYVSNLAPQPKIVNLGDTRYRIDEVWVEHRATVIRSSMLNVHLDVQPTFVLCLRIAAVDRNPNLSQSPVTISAAGISETYGPPIRNNMCIAIGTHVPAELTFTSEAQDIHVHVELSPD